MWAVVPGALDKPIFLSRIHLQLKKAAHRYIWDSPFDNDFHYRLNGRNSKLKAWSGQRTEGSALSRVQSAEAGCTCCRINHMSEQGFCPKLQRTLTLPRAQYAICRFAQTPALFLRQVTLPWMLAELPEPSSPTNAATAGTRAVACKATTGWGERSRWAKSQLSHSL